MSASLEGPGAQHLPPSGTPARQPLDSAATSVCFWGHTAPHCLLLEPRLLRKCQEKPWVEEAASSDWWRGPRPAGLGWTPEKSPPCLTEPGSHIPSTSRGTVTGEQGPGGAGGQGTCQGDRAWIKGVPAARGGQTCSHAGFPRSPRAGPSDAEKAARNQRILFKSVQDVAVLPALTGAAFGSAVFPFFFFFIAVLKRSLAV